MPNKYRQPRLTVKSTPPTGKKVLFVLKKRTQVWNPDDCYASDLSSGLLNSVRFVNHMINRHLGDCCQSAVMQVIDGNAIDREIHAHKPHLVVIEAIWVTPEKMRELSSKYQHISWVVRLHSEVPFLANEGVALDWLNRYCDIPRVKIATNSGRLKTELESLLDSEIFYLPNCYEIQE